MRRFKGKETISGIYIITNPWGYCYIGRTVDLKERIRRYRGCRCYSQVSLYNSIKEFGWKEYKLEMLENLIPDEDILNEREIYWIAEYRTNFNKHPFDKGLNHTDGGKGSTGSKASTQTKEKMQIAFKGDKNSFYGKNHSDETKIIMSEKKLGKYDGGLNPRAKQCLDTQTGIFFDCLKEACECFHINYKSHQERVRKLKSRFIYV